MALLFVGIFGVAAIYLSYTFVMMLIQVEQARTWQTVPGQLITQEMTVREKVSDAAIDLSEPMRSLKAQYKYTVDGIHYDGTRIDFNPHTADNFSGDRKARQQKLLIQNPLTVYIDPAHPERSVIDRSLPAENALFIVCFLFFPCGLAVLCMLSLLLNPFGQDVQMKAVPLTAIFNGGLALWLLVFHHSAYGFSGLTLLSVISLLFFAGAYFLFKRPVRIPPPIDSTLGS